MIKQTMEEIKMEKKIEFKDLAGWLKVGMVISWFVGVIYCISFIYGVCIGLAGTLQ